MTATILVALMTAMLASVLPALPARSAAQAFPRERRHGRQTPSATQFGISPHTTTERGR